VSSGRIRVAVADRQPLFREALSRTVRQRVDFQLVAEDSDGRAALEAMRETAPDVAVIDLHLPGLDGKQVLNAVVRDELPTRVLLLAHPREAAGAYEALSAGAAGWLSKAADERQLCAAIVAVARGEVALTPDVQTAIASEIRRRARGAEPVLDDRERMVLGFLAEGRSAQEIAHELHLSTGTVKASLVRLYRRLGVSERAAAVAVALRHGLID
jgi:two-component system nitrate/nitrite response regulator NarL